MTWEIREEIIDGQLKYLACEVGAPESQCAICDTREDALAIVERERSREGKE